MDSMQVPLIGGLLALLVLLLVLRTASRRRAGRADGAADGAADGTVAGAVDGDVAAEHDAAVGSVDPAEVDGDVHLVPVADADEADAELEARLEAQLAAQLPPVGTEHAVEPGAFLEAALEPSDEDHEPVTADEVPLAEPEQPEQPEQPELLEQPEQPVAPRKRGLFGRRRRDKAVAPVVEPLVDVDPDVELDAGAELDAELEPVGADLAESADSAESADDAGAPATAPTAGETPEQELKALREQLRALERVVQQQSADHPTAALAKVEETVAEQSAAYLRQVSLVVSGLAAHTSEDENPRRTLARVAAAVERLGVPNSMERPILPVSHELTSRSHGDGSAHPSHLREPQELGSGASAAPAAPHQVPDVFAGLDAAVAPAHPGYPVQLSQPVQPAQPAQPAQPVGPEAGPGQPLLPPLVQPTRQPEQPAARSAADPTLTLPAFGQSNGSLHDLSALAAYDDDRRNVPESHDGGYGADGGYAAAADTGLPSFEEPAAVLPVPPPAAPEPTGKRRGRRSR